MFDIFLDAITSWTTTLIGSADSAIGAMCRLAYGPIFGVVAGLVIGWFIIKAIFEDDLVGGLSKVFLAIIPMLIVAWLIKPTGAGCKVVSIKNDIVAMQTAAVSAVTGGGGIVGPNPNTMLGNVMSRTSSVFTNFFSDTMNAIQARGKEVALQPE